MGTTKTKRRYLIQILKVENFERHKQFEIKLPANIKKITGVIITTSLS